MLISLAGKNAIITGGSRGLGLATASRFVRSGGSVAILARGQADLDTAQAELTKQAKTNRSSARVFNYSCDVSIPEQRQATYDKIKKDLGPIDILVNNAGEGRPFSFENVDLALWKTDLDQKLMAAIHFSQLCWPDMKAKRWGRIINTLNYFAKAQAANTMPTSVTRAAGLAFTKALAFDGAPHNILVNGLLVGSIVSGQIERRVPDEEERKKAIIEGGKRIPMGRMGEAEEFANIACFLASEQASYLTGTGLNVDGCLGPVA